VPWHPPAVRGTWIEVHTYDGDDGSWDPDGNVAFTVVVP